MEGLSLIESKTREYSENYSALKLTVTELDAELQAVKKKYMNKIKRQADKVSESSLELTSAIDNNRALFEKPKTHIFHGIKVGLQKGKGKMEYDAAQVVKLIKKHFKDKEDVLIQVTEKPINKAMEQLSITDLKKLGVHIVEAQDEVVIKSTDSDIEKFVQSLIKEDQKNQEENAAA